MVLALILVSLFAVFASSSPSPQTRPDFPPFVMTIEYWDEVRVQYSDGRTIGGTAIARLDYTSRSDWVLMNVSDEVPDFGPPAPRGYACRRGTYGHIDENNVFRGFERDPAMCNGVGRWIHYGIAEHYGWKKEIADRLVTYTDPGERVVFDLKTGLPLLYEAGLTTGRVKHRTTFRLEWMAPTRSR